jgi:phenylacetate-CoA ligase
MADQALTDAERYPLLDDRGRGMLRRLLEHPHAPAYNDHVGDRLTEAGLTNVRRYSQRLRTERTGWRQGELPPWLVESIKFCRREVPFHRRRLDWTEDFFSLPAVCREDLRREPWSFVPDTADLSDLIVFGTAGTLGDQLKIPLNPEAAACYLPLMETALATRNVQLAGGNRVSIIQIHAQGRTLSYPSVMSYLDSAGFAKVNLNPADWRDLDDRARFLDDCNPELYTGDPLAFSELMKLPLRTKPKALLSSSATLLPGLRQQLEKHFGCPALDVYSLTESGPVAIAGDNGFEILPHDLYVEILDPDDRPCPAGTRGEVVLSGGRNPLLPLLRYRTGDYATLDFSGPIPVLVALELRQPVAFRDAAGRRFNNIDVTFALRELPLPFFALHQAADGSLRFRTRCEEATLEAAKQALTALFRGVPLTVEVVPESVAWAGKVIQYTSDLAE